MYKIICYFVLFLGCNLVSSRIIQSPEIKYQCEVSSNDDQFSLSCQNLKSVDELKAAMAAAHPLENIAYITIYDSDLPYLPSDIFNGTRTAVLSMYNSMVHSLSDSDLAFLGLENYLINLFLVNVQNMSNWNWLTLRDQQAMAYLNIDQSEFQINQELPSLKSLQNLNIIRSKISHIHPTAFSKLENLTLIDLTENNLTELSRSMFPRPAVNITAMSLQANLLTHLPSDMFEDMPRLYTVGLSSNHLTTLDEKTFSWALNHAYYLFFDGNYINCDCHLEWLKKVKRPSCDTGCVTGRCSLPSYLNGVSLWNLTNVPLYC